jgi:hypothetical protein
MKIFFIPVTVYLVLTCSTALSQTVPPGQARTIVPDDPVQDLIAADTTFNGARGYLIKETNALIAAYEKEKAENALLRVENAKLSSSAASAPQPTTPTPTSTPTPTPQGSAK